MIVITGKKYKKRLHNKPGRVKFVFVWPTNLGELTLAGMAMIENKPIDTIYTRMSRYGDNDPRVFSAEPLPKGSNVETGSKVCRQDGLLCILHGKCEMAASKRNSTETEACYQDFRHKCKRNSQLCKSYHACQSSRLGLPGSAVWVAPENTDVCFKPEPSEHRWLYNSCLSDVAISLNLRG